MVISSTELTFMTKIVPLSFVKVVASQSKIKLKNFFQQLFAPKTDYLRNCLTESVYSST